MGCSCRTKRNPLVVRQAQSTVRLDHIEDQPGRDASVLNFLHGLIDLLEASRLINHFCPTRSVQLEYFRQIQGRADNRADDLNPIEHRFEDRKLDRKSVV